MPKRAPFDKVSLMNERQNDDNDDNNYDVNACHIDLVSQESKKPRKIVISRATKHEAKQNVLHIWWITMEPKIILPCFVLRVHCEKIIGQQKLKLRIKMELSKVVQWQDKQCKMERVQKFFESKAQ